jgi:hypothetical protein
VDDGMILPGRPFNYQARDAAALLAAMLERVPTTLPEWTGHDSETDVGRVLLELFAHMGDILGYYTDAVANESFLGTAQTRRAVLQHLKLIGYQLSTAAPATAALTVTVPVPVAPAEPNPPSSPIEVAPGSAFTTSSGPDAPSVRFEYAGAAPFVLGPGAANWTKVGEPGNEVFESTKRLPVVEGRRIDEVIGVSDGTAHQRFPLPHPRVILRPAGPDPDVTIDDSDPKNRWVRQETLAFSRVGQPHFVVEVDDQDRATVVFGEEVPAPQTTIRAIYRVGGGAHGNVGAHTITSIGSAPQLDAASARVTNAERAGGGTDRESIAQAVRQGPAVFRARGRAVTATDYETQALAFGGVGKVRAHFLRATNTVRLTVAPAGGGDITDTLRDGLEAWFADKQAIGTRTTVARPAYVEIYVTAVVDVLPFSAPALVAGQVRDAVRDVLSFDRTDFGQTVYLSKFVRAIEAVDGVAGVHITEFATKDQPEAVEPRGKIQLGETQMARAPGPETPGRDWAPPDLTAGVHVILPGGPR